MSVKLSFIKRLQRIEKVDGTKLAQMAQNCYLRPVDGKYKPSIVLEDRNPTTLGRGPKTGIKNTFCARKQVVLVAYFDENKVKVTQLGRNACSVNGEPLAEKEETFLRHGEKLCLLQDQYPYVLVFNPPPGKVVKVSKEISDSDEECTESPVKRAKIEAPQSNWEVIDENLLIYKSHDIVHRTKIASFDLDGTLICPKSKGVFPKDWTDWKILYSEILEKLRKLIEDGFKIVIFTNQKSLTFPKLIDEFKGKVVKIVNEIAVPVEVYVAKGPTIKYRKPCIGMWEVMEGRNGPLKVNKEESFYCGDAAGRAPGSITYKGVSIKRPMDHSQCDHFFAKNIGIKFYTPEELFLSIADKRPRFFTAFNPSLINVDVPLCDESKQIIAPNQELVLLVGSPGSGKTQFSLTHMVPAGYSRVNRDEMKTIDTCLKLTEQYLTSGRSVVVDNTNGSKDARARFLQIAKRLSIPCRAFVMKITPRHAKHNNKFRILVDNSHAVVFDPVINAYFKSFVTPSYNEGFQDIVIINFWPMFKDRLHEKIYNLVLCEK